MPPESVPPIFQCDPCCTAESGFTLPEIALILMVVGLLIAGVVKGQEIMDGSKTRSLAKEFAGVQAALYAYQGRHSALPGDHRTASAADSRATVATTPAGQVGNGRIDGSWDSGVDSDESRLFWQHVRLAGFIPGPTLVTDPNYTPQTLFGTTMGISSHMQITAPTAMRGSFNVCAYGIPGKFAKRMDSQIDDGNTLTGAVRVADPATPDTALPTSAIADGGVYLLCYAF